MYTASAIAQNKKKVSLFDQDNAMPIQGATFEYVEQSGISDENGTIKFSLKEGISMKLSHINYVKWQLNNEEVAQLLHQKVYFRNSITPNLYPVTIIAV